MEKIIFSIFYSVQKTILVCLVKIHIVYNTINIWKKYFSIYTVTLSFGHKPYFTFQFKGPNYDYKRLDLLKIGLYAWYDIDVENKLDLFKSDHI